MTLSESILLFAQWRGISVSENLVKKDIRYLKLLCIYLHDPKIEDISDRAVVAYLQALRDHGWDDNTLIKIATSYRKLFWFLKKQGHSVFDHELIPVPQRIYRMPKVANTEHVKQLINLFPSGSGDPRKSRNRALMSLLYDTGGRISEILSLDIDQLDLKENGATIRTLKTRGRRPFRELLWSEKTNKSLIEWVADRKTLEENSSSPFVDQNALFITIPKKQFDTDIGKRLTRSGANNIMRRGCNKVGVPPFSPHQVRHLLAHDLVRKGSTADVMNFLGHSSLSSSTVYTLFHGTELRERKRMLGIRS